MNSSFPAIYRLVLLDLTFHSVNYNYNFRKEHIINDVVSDIYFLFQEFEQVITYKFLLYPPKLLGQKL